MQSLSVELVSPKYGDVVSHPAITPPVGTQLPEVPAESTSMPGRGPPWGIAAWQFMHAME